LMCRSCRHPAKSVQILCESVAYSASIRRRSGGTLTGEKPVFAGTCMERVKGIEPFTLCA
jgi:hypothetical protein